MDHLAVLKEASIIMGAMSLITGTVYWILKMKLKEELDTRYQQKESCALLHNQLMDDIKEIKDDIKMLIRHSIKEN